MSGHNKWSQIKRKKALTDGAKSKIFTRMSRLITLEARKAGGNLNSPLLAATIARAKASNMTNDAIERAIAKGSGTGGESLERVTYEAYGPEGAALIIEAITSNRNKASSEIKYILSQHEGSLGAIGSVTWGFKKTDEGWEAEHPLAVSPESAATLEKLINALEENEEVDEVFTNAEFPDESAQ
jgi:YebC/PmpR family DNA-binding regulatory protein